MMSVLAGAVLHWTELTAERLTLIRWLCSDDSHLPLRSSLSFSFELGFCPDSSSFFFSLLPVYLSIAGWLGSISSLYTGPILSRSVNRVRRLS